MEKPTTNLSPLELILAERRRQSEKWGEQNHDLMTWNAILTEEVGEFAEACLHDKFGGHAADKVEEECVHVAAVALQILEFIARSCRPVEVRDERGAVALHAERN